eukprot:Skav226813  [mRNA]  locus=scaffold6234:12963:14078:- [translate_table: standard]
MVRFAAVLPAFCGFSSGDWEISASPVHFSLALAAAHVMASQQGPGIRQSKLVLLVVLAVGLTMLSPTPCDVERMVTVFHYTSRVGYWGIMKSGHIRPSEIKQGDATYGTAVYATELPPSTPFFTVLQNNYAADGGIIRRGKDLRFRAEYVFAFRLPRESVKFIETKGDRSVLCIGGGEKILLDNCTYAGRSERAVHTLRVYHYTDRKGYEGILQSGHIRPSVTATGGGVYVTELPPSNPFFTILENNYGQESCMKDRGHEMMDRAEYVFVFDLVLGQSLGSLRFLHPPSGRSILRIGPEFGAVEVRNATYHGRVDQVLECMDWMKNKTNQASIQVEREFMLACRAEVPCRNITELIKSMDTLDESLAMKDG